MGKGDRRGAFGLGQLAALALDLEGVAGQRCAGRSAAAGGCPRTSSCRTWRPGRRRASAGSPSTSTGVAAARKAATMPFSASTDSTAAGQSSRILATSTGRGGGWRSRRGAGLGAGGRCHGRRRVRRLGPAHLRHCRCRRGRHRGDRGRPGTRGRCGRLGGAADGRSAAAAAAARAGWASGSSDDPPPGSDDAPRTRASSCSIRNSSACSDRSTCGCTAFKSASSSWIRGSDPSLTATGRRPAARSPAAPRPARATPPARPACRCAPR